MFEKCTLIWFHLNKNGQKVVKNQRIRSLKKKWPVEMVEKFLSNKFGVNPLDGFRENEYYTQTADARVTTHSSPACSRTKQSYIVKTRKEREVAPQNQSLVTIYSFVQQ